MTKATQFDRKQAFYFEMWRLVVAYIATALGAVGNTACTPLGDVGSFSIMLLALGSLVALSVCRVFGKLWWGCMGIAFIAMLVLAASRGLGSASWC